MARFMSCILALLFISSLSVNGDFNVADYGAIADGKTDASQSFVRAWTAACGSDAPTTIFVPRKRYLLGPVVFQGPCKNSAITIQLDGILVAPDYKAMGSVDTWIKFVSVVGVSIIGGYLNGQGMDLWACKAAGHNCPTGATSLAFFSSNGISISGLSSINSKLFHIVIYSSNNVTVNGVMIHAPKDSPNTDGIHVEDSTNVNIFSTGIRTGDDCISIGPGTRNLWIQRIACGPGHGISIGSLGSSINEAGVQNVTVKTVVFNGTMNGLRIKTWARPSNGFVKEVVFQHAVMIGAANPIIIDQNYCPGGSDCPHQSSGVAISQVTYKNIKGTSKTKAAMTFNCSDTTPCKGITLQDVELTYLNQPAKSFCQNIKGRTRGSVVPPSCF